MRHFQIRETNSHGGRSFYYFDVFHDDTPIADIKRLAAKTLNDEKERRRQMGVQQRYHNSVLVVEMLSGRARPKGIRFRLYHNYTRLDFRNGRSASHSCYSPREV